MKLFHAFALKLHRLQLNQGMIHLQNPMINDCLNELTKKN